MIDSHVHLRDWNQKSKETIDHGMKMATMAGIDCLFDMPNTNPPILHEAEVVKRLELGAKATKKYGVSYHLYVGLTFDKMQIKEAVELYNKYFPKVIGLKLFVSNSTGNMGILDLKQQELIYSYLKEFSYTGVLAVHCENESYFNLKETYNSFKRPEKAEVVAVRKQIENVRKTGFKGKLHICHISTLAALELVKQARKEISITCGITPHHALFNAEGANRNLKMNPPLRSKVTQTGMLEQLIKGNIDWVESDHAPHTRQDKEAGSAGIAGFANTLRLIKILKKSLNQQQLEAIFGENVKTTFELDDKISYDFSMKNIDQRIKLIDAQYPADTIY